MKTRCSTCNKEIGSDQVSDGNGPILSVGDIAAKCADLRTRKKEYLVAFLLDARHRVMQREVISIGTLTASLAHPREIFSPAVLYSAAAIVLAHNHPSGECSPSDEDSSLTKRIANAGRILGIELLDHIIVSSNGCYSFKSAGGLS